MTPGNSRIQQLAKLAAQQIKALTDAHNAQIEAIYRNYQAQVDALSQCSSTPTTTEGQDGEASADRLHSSSADLLPTDR